ncbi:growth arrest and DNA damage-inducible proteins-interacting protein 1 [Episyrphus balteatus]|uniref:growth arrest and DNA damage-inducible proteins-interacting protein 1 n=1 Tax=Episyrphus balteatus TaxID=286459 RepID=UPI002486C66E|nr:growth arrest and DNA damage-inducible proteins-interacting protein 1 [Episyrphus balteatus]
MKSMQSLAKIPHQSYLVNSIIGRNSLRFFATATKDDDELIEVPDKPPSFAEEEFEEPKPESFFNKSGLLVQHRKFLHNEKPYTEPHSWIHLTEKYQRKQIGRYGLASGVDPRICFPTKKDLEAQKRYEQVAFPYTLQELIAKSKNEEKLAKEQIQKREEEITKKLEKLEQWKADLNAKVAKKEADALAAKQRKERLVEEVRRHFGFKVDPRDERFKEMLEQKEKEDRKKQKEAKRKAKEEKMMAKLISKPAGKGIVKDDSVKQN